PFGAGCGGAAAAGGGGGFGGGGAGTAGPFVIAGSYTVALVVDGKTVDTKPLRVTDDPEVVLTSVDRKRLYEMEMEMHDLHRFATDASNAFASLNRQTTEVATAMGSRTDVPADVRASFDAYHKELT